MRLGSRLVCALFGHRPHGGRATYDITTGSFVDVSTTQYAVCARCGDVQPAPLTVVDEADGDETDAADDVETADERGAGERDDGTDAAESGVADGTMERSDCDRTDDRDRTVADSR
ncbi:hypothetical protein [Salinigranum halophilum]|uniref:hypothetical protein n=1 Tax=Salinigranum halophilum TaxID=2565931 RepID=UPI00115F7511|nr:hypothetical protein [Salinigranum halophilum]